MDRNRVSGNSYDLNDIQEAGMYYVTSDVQHSNGITGTLLVFKSYNIATVQMLFDIFTGRIRTRVLLASEPAWERWSDWSLINVS